MGPFYSLYRHHKTGNFYAVILDAENAEQRCLDLQFEGRRVPDVICKAFIHQYGGDFLLN